MLITLICIERYSVLQNKDGDTWTIENCILTPGQIIDLQDSKNNGAATVDLENILLENGEEEELTTVDFSDNLAMGEMIEDKVEKITSGKK